MFLSEQQVRQKSSRIFAADLELLEEMGWAVPGGWQIPAQHICWMPECIQKMVNSAPE